MPALVKLIDPLTPKFGVMFPLTVKVVLKLPKLPPGPAPGLLNTALAKRDSPAKVVAWKLKLRLLKPVEGRKTAVAENSDPSRLTASVALELKTAKVESNTNDTVNGALLMNKLVESGENEITSSIV